MLTIPLHFPSIPLSLPGVVCLVCLSRGGVFLESATSHEEFSTHSQSTDIGQRRYIHVHACTCTHTFVHIHVHVYIHVFYMYILYMHVRVHIHTVHVHFHVHIIHALCACMHKRSFKMFYVLNIVTGSVTF